MYKKSFTILRESEAELLRIIMTCTEEEHKEVKRITGVDGYTSFETILIDSSIRNINFGSHLVLRKIMKSKWLRPYLGAFASCVWLSACEWSNREVYNCGHGGVDSEIYECQLEREEEATK